MQTVSAVLENALAVNGWYCICPVGLADEKVKEIIQWTETQNKLCGYIDKDRINPLWMPAFICAASRSSRKKRQTSWRTTSRLRTCTAWL